MIYTYIDIYIYIYLYIYMHKNSRYLHMLHNGNTSNWMLGPQQLGRPIKPRRWWLFGEGGMLLFSFYPDPPLGSGSFERFFQAVLHQNAKRLFGNLRHGNGTSLVDISHCSMVLEYLPNFTYIYPKNGPVMYIGRYSNTMVRIWVWFRRWTVHVSAGSPVATSARRSARRKQRRRGVCKLWA